MDSFAKKILAQTNIMAIEAIRDQMLRTISAGYTATEDKEGYFEIENLRRVIEEAAVPTKASEIKAALGTPAKGGKKTDKPKKKRAPSAYLLFCGDKRSELKEENPEAKNTEITSMMGAAWKALTDEEKEPYNERAAAAKAELSDTEESKSKSKTKKAESGSDSDSSTKSKKKRTPSAYILFSKAKRAEVKEEYPHAKPTEITTLLGAAWKAAEEEEKAPFVREAADLKAIANGEGGEKPKEEKPKKKLTLAEKVALAKKAQAAARKAKR